MTLANCRLIVQHKWSIAQFLSFCSSLKLYLTPSWLSTVLFKLPPKFVALSSLIAQPAFLCSLGPPTCLGMALPIVVWALPCKSIIKKMPPQTWQHTEIMETYFQLRFFFPQKSLACIKLTKYNQHNFPLWFVCSVPGFLQSTAPNFSKFFQKISSNAEEPSD